jgi:hypothetical protein
MLSSRSTIEFKSVSASEWNQPKYDRAEGNVLIEPSSYDLR